MLASSAKKCHRERRKRCIFLVSPKFIWPKQRAPVSFYYFTFVLLTWWLVQQLSDAKYEITSSSEGDSGSGQCLSNVFSGPVGRTLAIAGQSFTNSWVSLFSRAILVHKSLLPWIQIVGFWKIRTLVRSGCDRDSCCLLQWKIQMSRSLGRRCV